MVHGVVVPVAVVVKSLARFVVGVVLLVVVVALALARVGARARDASNAAFSKMQAVAKKTRWKLISKNAHNAKNPRIFLLTAAPPGAPNIQPR